jgi:branched-chain amino acid transport system substrate-binding protein
MRLRLRTVVLLTVAVLMAGGCGPRFKQAAGGASAGQVATGDNGSGGSGGAVGSPSAAGGAATPTTLLGAAPGASGASGPVGPASTTGAAPGGGIDPGPSPGVTDSAIKIGYLLPLTGAAPVPSNFDKGARVYWDYINKTQGGIFGRKVQVVIDDTQSSASVGKDKAKQLIEQDKVFTIIVLDRLENQQAIGAYLNSRNFPSIEIQTPANLGADQTWTFGVTIDHAVQGKLIADYFVRVLHAAKAAVVYENTPTLSPGVNAFSQEIKALGASVVYSQSIDGQANDFSNQALALKQAGAPAAWLYMAPTPAAKLANQAYAVAYHPIWFANSISWGFDLVFTVGPTALAGARGFSPWLPLSDPRTNTYQQAYQADYNQTPDDLGLVGWGVGEIVGEALRRTGKALGQNAFRDVMQHLNFKPDLWAPLSFTDGVREGANVVAVIRESGGKWVLEHDFTSSF